MPRNPPPPNCSGQWESNDYYSFF
uniref:Uncharacterized protein n=1 Tax=Arundo donax TaxID=35708 RepID=A0A0A9BML2_ARUDO